MTQSALAVIDLERIAAVARASAISWGELVSEFLDSNARDAVLLRAAAAGGEFVQAGQLAHRVGGVCLLLGAARAAAACSEVEHACTARHAHALTCALLLLEMEILQLRSLLTAAGASGIETSPHA